MTQPTPTDAPKTLKATPELVDDPIGSLSPKEYVRSQEDLYNQYLADLRRRGVDFTVDTKTGTVKTKSGGISPKDLAFAEGITDPAQKAAYLASADENTSYEPDPIGSQYLTSLGEAELAMKRAAEDAAEAKKLQGSVQSYMDSEEDKTKEIQRQFKDFDARASLLYDLMGEEQGYGMAADDQNIQNMKAQKDLGMAINPGGYYTKPYMDGSLSSILAPSLPDYVRPDYRLNTAVGLEGPQGFDDPQYTSGGMPMYAAGTDPNKPREIFWPWRNE